MDPTRRFSDRVNYYVRARPTYPPALLAWLVAECSLTGDAPVADVGSGTGILTELLLGHGNLVFGVEPNAEMRRAAEASLSRFPRFRSVAGTAEATTLPDASVVLVTAGQAFHWFDRPRARAEFRRILRTGGFVALAWNERRMNRPPFSVAYEAVVRRYQTDLDAVHRRHTAANDGAVLDEFFGPDGFRTARFDNEQVLDWSGVEARLLSSSYMPLPGSPDYSPMMRDLRAAFDAHAADGRVRFEYDTRVYLGRL